MKFTGLAFTFSLFAAISGGAWASPITLPNPLVLSPGVILRVPFTTNPVWGPSVPDSLELSVAGDGTWVPPSLQGNYRVDLYDGGILLGSFSPPFTDVLSSFIGRAFPGYFESAASPSVTQGTFVDFTSILNGTINGRLEMQVLSGTLTLDTSRYGPSLNLIHNRTDGSGGAANIWLSVGEISFVEIPEPTSVAMLASGLPLVALLRHTRRRFRKSGPAAPRLNS